MLIRERLEEEEKRTLSPWACLSIKSKGRSIPEESCPIRTVFQHDRDRIIHSKSFRRLKHKTQVFLSPEGDHYRTRLTHTLEVSQIARTIAKALGLNEDLTEAIALGHDLGHTPFGHMGESVLNEIFPDGFHHAEHSLRVVEILEMGGRGLNLTWEVRDGILKHSKGKFGRILTEEISDMPSTLEGQVVRLADVTAYMNHDLDDAIRANIIRDNDIPPDIKETLGDTHSKRINTIVTDIIHESSKSGHIVMGKEVYKGIELLRSFLFQEVYESPVILDNSKKSEKIIRDLYGYYLDNTDRLKGQVDWNTEEELPERTVCDFIAGMTDRYAMKTYHDIFFPNPWGVY